MPHPPAGPSPRATRPSPGRQPIRRTDPPHRVGHRSAEEEGQRSGGEVAPTQRPPWRTSRAVNLGVLLFVGGQVVHQWGLFSDQLIASTAGSLLSVGGITFALMTLSERLRKAETRAARRLQLERSSLRESPTPTGRPKPRRQVGTDRSSRVS